MRRIFTGGHPSMRSLTHIALVLLCVTQLSSIGFAQSGIISTVAENGTSGFSGDGGPATEAQSGIPWGVAVDSAGHRYIADTGNSRIREVTAGSLLTTANTYHLFPQIADGYFADGSYYQSSVIVTNSNPGTTTPSCTLQFHGLTIGGLSSVPFTVTSGIYIYITPGTQSIQTGYASAVLLKR